MAQPRTQPRRSIWKWGAWVTVAGLALFGAIQLIPYGLDRTQMPAPNPFRWGSPAAEALARAACYDCHSNETRWWWAVKVAPFSWLAQSDITEAKRHLNFSAWDGRLNQAGLRRVLDRDMPPWQYTLAHPHARLTEAQKQVLVQGFQASRKADQSARPALTLVSDQGADAASIINVRCSACHSTRRALAYHVSDPARAKALVDRMIRYGAQVRPAEERALIDRFTR